MVTYDLTKAKGPVYQYLYRCIRDDIKKGILKPGEKLPSKRALAKNLGVSVITVENSYGQLMDEGYIEAVEKSGYYVSKMSPLAYSKEWEERANPVVTIELPQKEEVVFDFSSNRTEEKNFPFSVWAKLMRETISTREKELLEVSPCGGVDALRSAIAEHLSSFRGMEVAKEQIIVGAGTEYLYGLLIQLLSSNATYCLENPGYQKIRQVYESNGAICHLANMDEMGILVEEVRKSRCNVCHISPTHHFPTGITMPLKRRLELLSWAKEEENRYIIEDDYDSEFRLNGKPLPTLFGIDHREKVIYMNTFSKSLTSTIRISYMVLPKHLVEEFYRKLSFYSCTISTFEQYTLAAFIHGGAFEKHINRMRLHYVRKRSEVLAHIRAKFSEEECKIIERDSGLHFILELRTKKKDAEIENLLKKEKITLRAVTDYDMSGRKKNLHQFICNYSNVDVEGLDAALEVLKKVL
ncbi:MAG: PLP-dependent aminotransferase family protein [Lachnospiraceae bacterium]|nr:PLP-dependent aminotransferase family protein [Lachnospiraceae bacterium]